MFIYRVMDVEVIIERSAVVIMQFAQTAVFLMMNNDFDGLDIAWQVCFYCSSPFCASICHTHESKFHHVSVPTK